MRRLLFLLLLAAPLRAQAPFTPVQTVIFPTKDQNEMPAPMIQASPTSQWIVFATPLMVALLTIANLVIAKLAANKVDVVAAKAQTVANVAAQVATTAQQQSDKILLLADKTHTLVNSQYGIALALIVAKSALIYEKEHTPENLKELNNAKDRLAEHEAKQHVVDSKELA